jgi:hypothetical protein
MVEQGAVDVTVEFQAGNGIVRQSFSGVANDAPVFVTAAAVPVASAIPAVDPAGLALLALLVAFAAIQLRRRT